MKMMEDDEQAAVAAICFTKAGLKLFSSLGCRECRGGVNLANLTVVFLQLRDEVNNPRGSSVNLSQACCCSD